VWENTATSIPTGGGLMTRVCRFLGSVVLLSAVFVVGITLIRP
jgi:hypothetical protein